MLKKILSYGLVEGVTKGLNKMIFFIIPLLLTSDDFGKIGLIISLEALIPVLSYLGFDRAILRFYHKRIHFTRFTSTVFSSIRVSHIFLILALLLIHLLGVRQIVGLSLFPDVFLIVILVYLNGVNLFVLNGLRVDERHKNYFQARLILQGTRFLFVLFVIFFTSDYLGYLYGSIILTLLINYFYKPSEPVKFRQFNAATFRNLFIFSWPFLFHGMSMRLLSYADRFIVEKYLELKDVGVYTLAQSYGSTMEFAFVGVAIFMEPLIYKQNTERERKLMLSRFFNYSLLFGFVGFLIILLISLHLLPKLYPLDYYQAFHLIPLIALPYLIYPIYLKLNYDFIYQQRTKSIAVVSMISAVVSIGANFLMIPLYGLKGGVFVFFISLMVQAFGFSLLANDFKLKEEFWQSSLISALILVILILDLNWLIGLSLLLISLTVVILIERSKVSEYCAE